LEVLRSNEVIELRMRSCETEIALERARDGAILDIKFLQEDYIKLSEKIDDGNSFIEELQASLRIQEALCRDNEQRVIDLNFENKTLKENLVSLGERLAKFDEIQNGLTNANEALVRALSDIKCVEVERDDIKRNCENYKALSELFNEEVVGINKNYEILKLLLEDSQWRNLAEVSAIELLTEELECCKNMKNDWIYFNNLNVQLDSAHEVIRDLKSLLESADDEVARLRLLLSGKSDEFLVLNSEFKSVNVRVSEIESQKAVLRAKVDDLINENDILEVKYKDIKNLYEADSFKFAVDSSAIDLLNEELHRLRVDRSELYLQPKNDEAVCQAQQIVRFFDWHIDQILMLTTFLSVEHSSSDSEIFFDKPRHELPEQLHTVNDNLSVVFENLRRKVQTLQRNLSGLQETNNLQNKLITDMKAAYAEREEKNRIQLLASAQCSQSISRIDGDIEVIESSIYDSQNSEIKSLIDRYMSKTKKLTLLDEATQLSISTSFAKNYSTADASGIGESIFPVEDDAFAVDDLGYARCNLCENAEVVIMALKTELKRSIEREEFLVSKLQHSRMVSA
jgi:chromosome segregation ATPase